MLKQQSSPGKPLFGGKRTVTDAKEKKERGDESNYGLDCPFVIVLPAALFPWPMQPI